MDAESANAYGLYVSRNAGGSELAKSLVEALDGPIEKVIDLASGTGAASRVLLARHPGAQVWALDASEEMLRVARECDPPCISHVHVSGEDMHSVDLPVVDAAICCSAIWQMNIPQVLDQISARLRVGGQFVFNIGEAFLDQPTSQGYDSIRFDYELARSAIALGAGSADPDRLKSSSSPISLAELERQIQASDFELVEVTNTVQTTSTYELVEWLSIPEYLPRINGLDSEQIKLALRQTAERVPDLEMSTQWSVFKLRKSAP